MDSSGRHIPLRIMYDQAIMTFLESWIGNSNKIDVLLEQEQLAVENRVAEQLWLIISEISSLLLKKHKLIDAGFRVRPFNFCGTRNAGFVSQICTIFWNAGNISLCQQDIASRMREALYGLDWRFDANNGGNAELTFIIKASLADLPGIH